MPLPYWARFFADLGGAIGSETASGRRTVAGLAVPVRSYAAAFAAAGVVRARSAVPVSPSDPYEYFRWLATIPAGTPVTLVNGTKEYKGVFLGCEHASYGPLAGVQVEKTSKNKTGGLSRWFPPETSTCIRLSDKEISAAKLPNKQGGKSVPSKQDIVSKNRFAQHFLGTTDAYEFVTSSRLECVIVGHTGLLRQEIKETVLASRPPQVAEFVQGTLQDVIRVRKFSGANDKYRTSVVYANGKALPEHFGDPGPAVVVFDGAAGFIRWRGHFRSSNWIVAIARPGRLADDAASLLNGEYLQNRIEGEFALDTPPVPAGTELTVFQTEAG